MPDTVSEMLLEFILRQVAITNGNSPSDIDSSQEITPQFAKAATSHDTAQSQHKILIYLRYLL